MAIFQELDNLEANLYGQIVHQRIKVIRTLQEKINENTLEKVIQKYLFDHLWLIDPSWERAEGTEIMERTVKSMFDKINDGLTEDESSGRLDIGYRKTAGQHIIIELKRPERMIKVSELTEQVSKYRDEMQKILDMQGTGNEPIEIIALLGCSPRSWDVTGRKSRDIQSLRAYDTRIVFYNQLLADAEKIYCDYYAKRKIVDKLSEIMQAIEDYAPPSSP